MNNLFSELPGIKEMDGLMLLGKQMEKRKMEKTQQFHNPGFQGPSDVRPGAGIPNTSWQGNRGGQRPAFTPPNWPHRLDERSHSPYNEEW